MALCNECQHFIFAVNPETKRKLPSQKGKCGFPVVWPELPKAYEHRDYGGWKVQLPLRSDMPPWDNRECKCFKAKEPKLI